MKFASQRRPEPEAAPLPEWEPYGLPGRPTTLERHLHIGEIRVRPDVLAEMKAAWVADMEDDE